MGAEGLWPVTALVLGLLTFAVLELLILIGLRLAMLRQGSQITGAKAAPSNDQAVSVSCPVGEAVHFELRLVAPELVEAIRALRSGPELGEGVASRGQVLASRPPKEPEGKEPLPDETVATTRPSPTLDAEPTREIAVVQVSRSGAFDDKIKIGTLQSMSEKSFRLMIAAKLPQQLVFDIAERVGQITALKADLRRLGNNEDPLSLVLDVGPLDLNFPALRDPKTTEVEFNYALIANLGRGRAVTYKVDERTRPVTVRITEARRGV